MHVFGYDVTNGKTYAKVGKFLKYSGWRGSIKLRGTARHIISSEYINEW